MNKLQNLKNYLRGLENVAVAFSGGVDSTFLLKIAQDVLGDNILALTAQSCFIPRAELLFTKKFCADNNIKQKIFVADVLNVDNIKNNPPERCYHCKKIIFEHFLRLAEGKILVEGSNIDDLNDYRPGARAIKELNIKSPLQIVGLSKAEIRNFSQELNLPTWNKPSMACLASRIPYGDILSAEKLSMIENAENFLISKGFNQLRVRAHGKIARIEIPTADFNKIIAAHNEIAAQIKNFGFDYVTLDLQGYRTGSLNELLNL